MFRGARIACFAATLAGAVLAVRGQEAQPPSARGRPISPRLLGHNWMFTDKQTVPNYARAMRGVAAGLGADFYDWRTRAGDWNNGVGTTLQFLQDQRDNEREPVISLNMRGVPGAPPGNVYADTRRETVADMAASYLRYVNRFLHGDLSATDAEALVKSIRWGHQPVQLASGEKATPLVQRWQIGNEPLAEAGKLPSGRFFLPGKNPTDYVVRYTAIAKRVRQEWPAAKVGPVIAGGEVRALAGAKHLQALFASPAPLDFVHYQPYQHLEEKWPDETAMAAILATTRQFLVEEHHKPLVMALQRAGRNPPTIELGLSEFDPAGWNGGTIMASQARALGVAEFLLTAASLGYDTAMIWNRVAEGSVRWPAFHVYQRCFQYLGTAHLSAAAAGNNSFHATYDARTDQTHLWLINSSPDQEGCIRIEGGGLPPANATQAWVLGRAVPAATRLTDFNDAAQPDRIDWRPFALPENQPGEGSLEIRVPPACFVHVPLKGTPSLAAHWLEPRAVRRPPAPEPARLSPVVFRWQRGADSSQRVFELKKDRYPGVLRGDLKVVKLSDGEILSFGAKGGWMEVPDLPHLAHGPGHRLHIRFWMRTTAKKAMVLMDRGRTQNGGPMREISLMLEADGRLAWVSGCLVRNYQFVIGKSRPGLNDGIWHSVDVQLENGQGQISVDGTTDAVWQIDWSYSVDAPFLVGARTGGDRDGLWVERHFEGEMRDVLVEYETVPAP